MGSTHCVQAKVYATSGVKDEAYVRGCAATCSASSITQCNLSYIKCEVSCCSADLCNGAAGPMVGGLLLIVAAYVMSISYPESSGFLVSGATPGRLWGHRILLPQDFCGKTMETVTEQPIKKIQFFRCPQSLPGVAPLTKKPEDSGYEIDVMYVFGS